MTEKETIINKTNLPNTVSSLVNDFKSIGIKEGMTLLVHSSLSSLGWVCGGPVAVILALEEVLTVNGTLIMPTHSSDYSDPAEWCNPPVPETWWDIIRNEMPLFDKNLTPTREMGKIAETFRKQNGVIRSNHPGLSFAAWGRNKEYILQDEHYDFSLNEKSPLGRIYELNGNILLLGVDDYLLCTFRCLFSNESCCFNSFAYEPSIISCFCRTTDLKKKSNNDIH